MIVVEIGCDGSGNDGYDKGEKRQDTKEDWVSERGKKNKGRRGGGGGQEGC